MGSALGSVTKPSRVIQPGRSPERAIETVTVPPHLPLKGQLSPRMSKIWGPRSELCTLAAGKGPLERLL